MTQIYDWSLTASENDDADSTINWAEGQLAPTINNSARAMMARVAAFRDVIGGVATYGGSSNAYTITSPSGHAITAYSAGLIYTLKANHTNTGAATVNIDGLGTKSIVRVDGAAMTANAIVSGGLYLLVYDGTNFQVFNVANSDVRVVTYTSGSGTYTPASDVVAIRVTCVGGGGGGAGVETGSGTHACGGGGGGGGTAIKWIKRSLLAASYSYAVGAAGAAGSAAAAAAVGSRDGGDGGATTFSGTGVSLTANGGVGADEVAASSGGVVYAGGTGGNVSGGDINIAGQKGDGGATDPSDYEHAGSCNGGHSYLGLGGAVNYLTPANGSGYGAGGSGSMPVPAVAQNVAGGAGSAGIIIIEEFTE